MKQKTILIIIAFLNAMVLLGQVWPEGAPPFARIVNIITLVVNLIFVFLMIRKQKLT